MLSSELLKNLEIVDYAYTEKNRAESYDKFYDWVAADKHQPLSYLADHRKLIRKDIKFFFPEFESALVFLFDYSAEKKYLDEFYHSKESNGLKISSYVFGFNGEDYHIEIRRRLERIIEELVKINPRLITKLSLDIHPVLERDLAHRSGLGWFGKNSMLINRKEGSFVMIASILLNERLPLIEKSDIETDHCGSCTDCIDACPTDAIDAKTRTLISAKCISTWTIELFKEAPELKGHPGQSNGEIFGCDICQDVCPWNIKKLAKVIKRRPIKESAELLFNDFLKKPVSQIYKDLETLSNNQFRKIYALTPLSRTGRKSLMKNVQLFLP
jgi:epoxyqueuosine reductase